MSPNSDMPRHIPACFLTGLVVLVHYGYLVDTSYALDASADSHILGYAASPNTSPTSSRIAASLARSKSPQQLLVRAPYAALEVPKVAIPHVNSSDDLARDPGRLRCRLKGGTKFTKQTP